MARSDRKELLDILAQNYLVEKEKNKVFGRENAQSYTFAKGQLQGACMALNLDFEESDEALIIYTSSRKRVVAIVKK